MTVRSYSDIVTNLPGVFCLTIAHKRRLQQHICNLPARVYKKKSASVNKLGKIKLPQKTRSVPVLIFSLPSQCRCRVRLLTLPSVLLSARAWLLLHLPLKKLGSNAKKNTPLYFNFDSYPLKLSVSTVENNSPCIRFLKIYIPPTSWIKRTAV